jgi:hypothetical protein
MSDRFELRGVVAPTLMLLVMAGCGGGDGGGGGASGGGGGAAVENPVDAATAGNIAGSIVFEGAAPSMDAIDMSSESVCADKHASTPMVPDVVVNSNGTLANVFVYVKEGLESLQFPTPGAVLLDQNGCVYMPHVLGVMAGQDITIRNSDGLLHNINASPTEQRGFNTSQPVAMETTRSFGTAEVMVPLRCDVHGWMNAYIGVLDHPYHSVSNGSGAFDLSTLPPGEYVIEAWHERYGTQTQTVTVTTGGTAEVTFTFSASMAQNAVVPLGAPIDLHAIAEAS